MVQILLESPTRSRLLAMRTSNFSRVRALVAVLAVLTGACSSADQQPTRPAPEPEQGQQIADPPASPWHDPSYAPPTRLVTSRILLEPLAGRHVELDYAALMGSREHLQRTLRWGDWPRTDFTLEENLGDLERHWQEFEDREGYAFTVLSLDRSQCLGCIYLEPADPNDRSTRDAMLAYWVIEEELASELDRHLLAEVLAWIERDWLFEKVVVPTHVDNDRGVRLADELGLDSVPTGSATHVIHVWQR